MKKFFIIIVLGFCSISYSIAQSIDYDKAMDEMRSLNMGGTAVGTGLNAPKGFDTGVAEEVSKITGKEFITASNKFHALTSKDELVFAHGAVKALAITFGIGIVVSALVSIVISRFVVALMIGVSEV